MTLHAPTPTEPLDRALLAEIESYLAAYGLKVTKARATRAGATSTEPAPIGPKEAKAPKGHGACAAHWRVPGMRKPVCIVPEGVTIREDGKDTGELVPAEWTDVDTVLAFAVDVADRMAEYRTRGAVGYRSADQSTSSVGFVGTLDASKARTHTVHAFPSEWTAYGIRVGCDKCAELKAEQDEQAARKAARERMRAQPHAFDGIMRAHSCELCGAEREHEAHVWPAHAYVNAWGKCATCGQREDKHTAAA